MLDDICMQNKVIRWWNWWKVHRYHLVPALRGFGWTSTNWAEIGQSKMKRHICIGLMDALFTDIIHAINERIEWIAFVKNTGKSIGKGPTVLAKRLKECKEIREYAQSIIDALQQGRLLPDMEKHSNPDRYFMGSAMSKHRVPNTYPVNNPMQKVLPKGKGKGRGKGCSNRGKAKGTVQFVPAAELLRIGTADSEDSEYMSGPDINPDMPPSASTTDAAPVPEPVNISDTIPPQVGTEQRGCGRHGHGRGGRGSQNNCKHITGSRRNPDRERRGHNRRYDNDDSYSTDEELHPFDVRSPTAEQEKVKLTSNPATYVFLPRPREPSSARWCQGCKRKFVDDLYNPPLNLVFHFKTIVSWYQKGGIQ